MTLSPGFSFGRCLCRADRREGIDPGEPGTNVNGGPAVPEGGLGATGGMRRGQRYRPAPHAVVAQARQRLGSGTDPSSTGNSRNTSSGYTIFSGLQTSIRGAFCPRDPRGGWSPVGRMFAPRPAAVPWPHRPIPALCGLQAGRSARRNIQAAEFFWTRSPSVHTLHQSSIRFPLRRRAVRYSNRKKIRSSRIAMIEERP